MRKALADTSAATALIRIQRQRLPVSLTSSPMTTQSLEEFLATRLLDGYSLIEGFRLNFNIMRDAVGVGQRDPDWFMGAII